MSTSEPSHGRHYVAEATPEEGRAFVARARNPESIVPKFEPNQEAWLEDDEGDRPGCDVIIVLQHQKPEGTWEYTLKYKDSGNPVKNGQGGDWFPETLLRREKPWY